MTHQKDAKLSFLLKKYLKKARLCGTASVYVIAQPSAQKVQKGWIIRFAKNSGLARFRFLSSKTGRGGLNNRPSGRGLSSIQMHNELSYLPSQCLYYLCNILLHEDQKFIFLSTSRPSICSKSIFCTIELRDIRSRVSHHNP